MKTENAKVDDPLSEYMRTDGVVNMVPVSRRSLERMKRRGQIPFIRAGARLVLFKRADIIKAMDRLTVRG